MKLGDLPCPWHPGMTLLECKELHEQVTEQLKDDSSSGHKATTGVE